MLCSGRRDVLGRLKYGKHICLPASVGETFSYLQQQCPWQRTGCLAAPLALCQGRPQGDRPKWPVDGLIGWVMRQ